MWYVLQTMTGREEELVHYIEEIVPKELYTDCFVAYYERVWSKSSRKASSMWSGCFQDMCYCFGYAEGAVPVSRRFLPCPR